MSGYIITEDIAVYALALFHNQRYEEAKLYNQLCIEQNEFPPAFRNQVHISIGTRMDQIAHQVLVMSRNGRGWKAMISNLWRI